MKVIKTYFDEKGYKKELSKAYDEIKNQMVMFIPQPFDTFIHPRTEAELMDKAKERVNRESYEKTVEYQYLNAVVESGGRPLLIVYNEEEGVKTIYADNCKLVQE